MHSRDSLRCLGNATLATTVCFFLYAERHLPSLGERLQREEENKSVWNPSRLGCLSDCVCVHMCVCVTEICYQMSFEKAKKKIIIM